MRKTRPMTRHDTAYFTWFGAKDEMKVNLSRLVRKTICIQPTFHYSCDEKNVFKHLLFHKRHSNNGACGFTPLLQLTDVLFVE